LASSRRWDRLKINRVNIVHEELRMHGQVLNLYAGNVAKSKGLVKRGLLEIPTRCGLIDETTVHGESDQDNTICDVGV
jgi:hypothetical protein